MFKVDERRSIISRMGASVFSCLMAAIAASAAGTARADLLNPLDFPSLGKVVLPKGVYTIDTTGKSPTLKGPGIDLSGTVSASSVAVFRFDDLTVHEGAIITAAENSDSKTTRPVALLSSGDLTFAGEFRGNGVDGSDGRRNNGGVGGKGRFGGGNGTNARGTKPGGVPGEPHDANPAIRLSGGKGGGGGIFRVTGGGGGGGGSGGGAIELGAFGKLTLKGSTLNLNGGKGGDAGEGNPGLGSGAGGGTGGAVLLHGSEVTLGGIITAQGGNGGIGRGNGAGGAGGRVAIQAIKKPDTTGVSIAGGTAGESVGVNGAITYAQPQLTISNLDFGSVAVGSSVTIPLTVRNTGSADSFLHGQFPAVESPVTRVGTGIFSGLKGNDSTTCAYKLAPKTPGPFRQTVLILTNAGQSSITFTGTAISPAK